MILALLIIASLVIYLIGIRYYSVKVSKNYNLDHTALTPAYEFKDGIDYIPTKKFYLLGQHFAAISAAGPIVGPILACIYFGWGPSIIWIVLGAIFIGAVHDFSSLASSIKNKAKSIAEMVKALLGKRSYIAFIFFIWISLEYVIIAFTDVTASGFVKGDGPIIASSSTLYLLLGVVMGFCLRVIKMPLWAATIIFVPLTFATVYFARFIPLDLTNINFIDPRILWGIIILAYCFIASVIPMWLLLQPRGYLGGFFLYITLLAGIIGIVTGGFEIRQDFFKGFSFNADFPMPLFPFLFVTIACGACSGFHSLVCSGTTSKQLDKETDARVVGYTGMIMESVMALIALATVIIVADSEIFTGSKITKPAPIIYGHGIGKFLEVLGIPFSLGSIFGAMAFTTFVYDTLDVATRLGRYILQELMGFTVNRGKYMATFITCAVPALILFFSSGGAWKIFWALFGSSNQLLAALVLLAVSCWLYSKGKNMLYTFIPMVFMFTLTVISLLMIVYNGLNKADISGILNSTISMVLIILSLMVLYDSVKIFGNRTIVRRKA